MGQKNLRAMAERWEQLARADPMHFIATRNREWTPAEFYASAQPLVDRVIDWIGPDVPASQRRRMLEIGCGLGRVTASFARHFDRADGVDISAAMIEQAGQANLPANLHLAVVDGESLRMFTDQCFDLVYCGLVFQHIPEARVIRAYLAEIARVLQPNGRAVLQFDTRRQNFMLRAYKALPDILLPANHRRFIRRHRRDPDEVRRWMIEARLQITAEHCPGAAEHYFVVKLQAEH